MKKILSILIAFFLLAPPLVAQKIGLPVLDGSIRFRNSTDRIYEQNPPFIAISSGQDIIAIPPSRLALINPNAIQSINVVKNQQAVELYGQKAENGAVLITLKENEEAAVLEKIKAASDAEQEPQLPFVYFDQDSVLAKNSPLAPDVYYGIKTDNTVLQVTREALQAVDPAWIKSIEVLKDKAAVATYGAAARNGAVLITFEEKHQARALQKLKEFNRYKK